MTTQQAIAALHALPRLGDGRPGLDRMHNLLDHLGNPEKDLQCIHIAGTNGKGSLAAMTASILTAAGYKTGLTISPFVVEFRERFQIDGQMIPPRTLAQLTEKVMDAIDDIRQEGGETPVEFEAVTAVAMLWFAREKCDLVVLETGLGGRYDATNAVPHTLVAAITRIGYDHTELLGDTLDKIAAEKAGIIKEGCAVVCYPDQPPEAMGPILAAAAEAHTSILTPETEDIRTYEAAEAVLKEGTANLILIGSEEEIAKNKGDFDISGATIVDLSEYNMPPLMVLKSDGATSYATRDLAAAIYRYETYKFDKSLYVTSAGQSLHFAQLFKVLELMGYKWADRLMHVPYGTFSINGEKIASRTGNVVLIDDLFADAIEKAKKVIDQKNPLHENKEETAKAVGLGAIIFNTLLSGRIRDVNFNWEEALSFEGNTGPYVQYTYARCCSVLAKSGSAGFEVPDSAELAEEEIALVNVLAQFPSRVEAALEQCEPSVITRYSLDVCSAFNSFYNNSRIIGSEGTTRELRLALTAATRDVLGNALDLIGLKKMSAI